MMPPAYPALTQVRAYQSDPLSKQLSNKQLSNQLNHTQLWQGRWQWPAQGRQFTTPLPVFIKQLQPDAPPWQREQFLQSHKVLHACQALAVTTKTTPYGITQLIAANLSPISPSIVLRYYTGQTLAQCLSESSLTLPARLNIAIKICQTVDALHHRGYLHRDIKPSNILLTPTAQVILLDFGLAQSIDAASLCFATTAGTPAYMSPEQLTGQVLTPQSDYYSLGVLLFELFSGHKPFTADTLQGWALAHCQQPLPWLPPIPQLSPHQQLIVQHSLDHLLAKYPQHRPCSLFTVIKSLQSIQATH